MHEIYVFLLKQNYNLKGIKFYHSLTFIEFIQNLADNRVEPFSSRNITGM